GGFHDLVRTRVSERGSVRPLLNGKDAGAPRTSVEDGRRHGVDGQGPDGEIGQAGVESAPALAAVGALEDAAVPGAGVKRARRLRVDGQGKDSGGVGQACIDSAPALAAVGALEDPAEVASK